MSAVVASTAAELGAPVVLLLEGGYDLGALADSVGAVLCGLRDERDAEAAKPGTRVDPIIDRVLAMHEHFEPLASAGG